MLPPPLRAPAGVLAVLAALAVTVLGLSYPTFDEQAPAEHGVGQPWRTVALVIDFCGEPVGSAVLITALAVGFLAARRWRAALLIVAGPGLAVVSTMVLKPITGRTIHGENLSFPSGHTAFATAVALVLVLLAVGRRQGGASTGLLVFVVPAGAAMGWAQVALGAHYPTDTVGGFGTALAVVPVVGWLADRVPLRHGASPATAPTAGEGFLR